MPVAISETSSSVLFCTTNRTKAKDIVYSNIKHRETTNQILTFGRLEQLSEND